MTRILLSGCSGQMGAAVTRIVSSRDDCEIVAGIDLRANPALDYPIFASFSECDVECDVIIDFSLPSSLDNLLDYAVKNSVPSIICTTGYTDEQVEKIKNASKSIPVFYSGNMSLGINLLMSLSKKAAAILGSSFDIEIVEKHHNQKVDAPSGTALMLAAAVSESLEEKPRYEFDRHSKRGKRTKNEIGIHSIRGGTIVGEHDVIFAGQEEVITLSHSAQSKGVFASGAVNAAVFIIGKDAGLYDMSDMI